MNKVIAPEHVAKSVEKDLKEKQQKESKKPKVVEKVDNAFVNATKRVLDPTLLDKTYLERMPQPSGWRILILPYRGKGVTEGGIHLLLLQDLYVTQIKTSLEIRLGVKKVIGY